MSKYLSEEVGIRTALAPDADRYNGNPASDIFNLGKYEKILFAVLHGAGATGTVVATVEACSDNSGTGAEAIAFQSRLYAVGAATGALTSQTASGVTIAAGENQTLTCEVKSDDLPDGKPFVRLKLTEGVDSPVDAGAVAILSGPRYNDGNPEAAQD